MSSFYFVCKQFVALSLIFFTTISQQCSAATQYWQAPFGGSGIWNNITPNWANSSAGPATVAWGGDQGVFENTPGTVLLGDNVAFNALEFSTTNYAVAPGLFQLNPKSPATITTDPGITTTISSNVNCAGDFHKAGTGTLTLTGTTTVPGVNVYYVDEGTVSLIRNGVITGAGSIIIGNTTNNNAITMNGPLTSMSSVYGGSLETLGVGISGSNNTLYISNGAQVTNTVPSSTFTGTIIGNNVGANSNSVTVTGAGSSITDHRVFYVGLLGDYNTLSILNGGQVLTDTGDFVVGSQASATFNSMLIDGVNSKLNVENNRTVVIGDFGSNNTATISNGGVLTSNKDGRIGRQANANNNSVTVTDTGSLWQITGSPTGTLRIGSAGSNNVLQILNGGAVAVTTKVILGNNLGANGNSIVLDGAGSSLTIGPDPSPPPNPDLFIGIAGANNSVTLTNGASLTAQSGIEIAEFITSSGSLNIGTGGAPGTVSAAFVSGGAGRANLIFNHNSSRYTFSPPLANNLAVQHIGSGTTILTGVNSIPATYQTGPTTITDGTLQAGIENVFSPLSTYTTQNDGVLSLGGFNQSTGPLNNSGIVTFGGSTAGVILTVNSDYTQTASGNYNTKINSRGQSDLMSVTGTANLAGTLDVVPSSGYSLYTLYHLIHANTSRVGVFNNVTSNNPLVIGNVIYDPNDVFVFFQQNLQGAARSCNEYQVAGALDSIIEPTGDALFIMNTLVNLSVDDARSALNDLAGEQYTYLIQMERFGCERFNRSVFNAIRATLTPCWCQDPCEPIERWFQIEGGQGFAYGDRNCKGLTDSNVDISLGAFSSCCDGFLAGVAATYELDHVHFRRGGHTNWNTVLGSLYGTYQNERGYAYADFICGGSWGRFNRTINFAGIKRIAKSSPSTVQGLINLEVGTNYCCCQTLFQPFVAVEFGFYNQRKVTEHGADSLNLFIKKRNWNTVDTYLGSHMTGYWDCLTINADLAWQHCFNTLNGRIENAFENSSTFSIDGIRIGNNAIVGAVNVSAEVCDNVKLYGELSGQGWRKWSSYSVAVGIMAAW